MDAILLPDTQRICRNAGFCKYLPVYNLQTVSAQHFSPFCGKLPVFYVFSLENPDSVVAVDVDVVVVVGVGVVVL